MALNSPTTKKKIDREPLPLDEAVGIAVQVAVGLGKAPAHGFTHRDIKPANIIVTSDDQVKIVDFEETLVQVYVLAAQYEKAHTLMEDVHSRPGSLTAWELRLDPLYDPLRGSACFQAIVQRAP